MRHPKWISAHDLNHWAGTPRGKFLLPEIIRRLVFGSVSRDSLQKVNFPAEAEVYRPGYDGTTVSVERTPFVPDGVAFWELGCVADSPKRKAQQDYDDRIKEHRERISKGEKEDLSEASFIAVTAFDWQDANKWAAERQRDGYFKSVLAYDSNNLEHWLQDTPAVALWLAQEIHGKREGVSDLSAMWSNMQSTLIRPLPSKVLLVNREAICNEFSEWLKSLGGELAVKAPSRAEVILVFCAWVEALPQEEQERISSRAIIVENRDTWRALAASKQPLILIAAPELETNPELVAEGIRQGHHVLRFADFRTRRESGAVDLPMMRRFDLEQALAEAGLSESEARQLAETAGGNFTILKRRYARTDYQRPEWAEDGAIAPILLAAAWEDAREADQEVVSTLAGKRYEEVQQIAKKWRFAHDPPLRFVDGIWEFLSPLDAWENLHPFLGTSQMECFERIAVDVLTEDDPGLELPPAERIMASVKGKIRRYSPSLRRGISEILALGSTREKESCVGNELNFAMRAAAIVDRILPRYCSWKRWASLGELLSLLMEAAPETILERMESDLNSEDPQLIELFRQEISGGLTGAAYHTGVLWALETAAWSPDYMRRVTLILARLTKSDPGGTWANRPLPSAGRVFFSQWPQTMAPLDDRVEALTHLSQIEPDGAWKIILSLLPGIGGMVLGNPKPSYRTWAAGWTGKVTRREYSRFLNDVTRLALSLLKQRSQRWLEMLDHFLHLPRHNGESVLEGLQNFANTQMQPELRVDLWKKLRKLVQEHSHFRDSRWAMDDEKLAKLTTIRDVLKPNDVVATSAYLFDDAGQLEGEKDEPFQLKEERREEKRRQAIREIWNERGLSAVLDLLKTVRQPWYVGLSVADEIGAGADSGVLPALLVESDKATQSFALAYAMRRNYKQGREWAESLPSNDWSAQQMARLATQMPFDQRTWDWVDLKGDVVRKCYWQEAPAWGGEKLDIVESERAAKQFQLAGRPWSALEHFVMRLNHKQSVRPGSLCDILDEIALNPTGSAGMDVYNLQQAFEFLQNNSDADETRVARLEFVFLPFLNVHSRLPLTLQRQLARDPEFFVDCLKVLYRPHKEVEKLSGKEDKKSDDSTLVQRAERVWQLLRDWREIPGAGPNGISLDRLREWVFTARKRANEEDRLEVCDVTLGQLFARSNEDVDHAKPLIPIREIIEECESPEIERGFQIGLHNLRGVVSKGLYEGGAQERKLAAQFEQYAKICSPWPRTAASLRTIAKDYLHRAEREDESARNRR